LVAPSFSAWSRSMRQFIFEMTAEWAFHGLLSRR
jgi:hypothetical protein